MLVISDTEKEKIDDHTSCHKRDLRYSMGISALFHAALFGIATQVPTTPIAYNSIKVNPSVQHILDRNDCTPNLNFGILTDEEQEFVDTLVYDLSDGYLDSMSLGESIVTAEVYTHNSEQRCLEDTWSLEEELDWYNGYEAMVYNEFVTAEKPEWIVGELFNFLHNGIYPHFADDPVALELKETYGDFVEPVLFRNDDFQSRLINARKTGRYNCKAGTRWLTVLSSSHPRVGPKIKVRDYDGHKSSVLVHDGIEFSFENTDESGAFIEPEKQGVIRPLEVFPIEYLVGLGIPISDLHPEFASWYSEKVKPAESLIVRRTNDYGTTSITGVSSKTIDDELAEVPDRYPKMACAEGTSEGLPICISEFNSDRYDWIAIADELIPLLEEQVNDVPKYYGSSTFYNLLRKAMFASENIFFNAINSKPGYDHLSNDPNDWKPVFEQLDQYKKQALDRLYTDLLNPPREGARDTQFDNYDHILSVYQMYAKPGIQELEQLLELETNSRVKANLFINLGIYFYKNNPKNVEEEILSDVTEKWLALGRELLGDAGLDSGAEALIGQSLLFYGTEEHSPEVFKSTMEEAYNRNNPELDIYAATIIVRSFSKVFGDDDYKDGNSINVLQRQLRREQQRQSRKTTDFFCQKVEQEFGRGIQQASNPKLSGFIIPAQFLHQVYCQ